MLASISNHLSRSCSHYKLEMNFSNISKTNIASVYIEPAVAIKVYDWWVPTYSKYVKQPTLKYIPDDKEETNYNQNGSDDDAWDFVINNF